MKAAIFSGVKSLQVKDYNLKKLLPDELLIKVSACGVCGTDFHIYEGSAPASAPVVIGHEYSGIVEDLGAEVSEFEIGDCVTINPNIHCGHCEFCKKGYINLCKNLKALGVTIDGGFAEYSIVPQNQVYKIPHNFSLIDAAFAEPLSCCVHGINLADIKLGDTVTIIGAGTIGLIMLQLAKLKGASKVIAIDILENKLQLADKLGADFSLNSLTETFDQDFKDLLPSGSDIVIECAGNSHASKTALSSAIKGGRIVLFGLASPAASIDLYLQEFFHKELTIKSSLLNPYTFKTAVDLLITKKVRVDMFNIKKYSLDNDDLNNLFTVKNSGSVIKNMIIPNK